MADFDEQGTLSISKPMAYDPAAYNADAKAQFEAAYAAAYADLAEVVQNSHNPHLKNNFADLGAVLKAGRAEFRKHGLSLRQSPGHIVTTPMGPALEIIGILAHRAGWSERHVFHMPIQGAMKGLSLPQVVGISTSYGKRYQAQALFCLSSTGEDTDGHIEQDEEEEPPKKAKSEKDVKALVEALKATTNKAELKKHKAAVIEMNKQVITDLYSELFTAYQAAEKSAASE